MTLGMTVAEAQSRVSSAEFTEWMALRQVEPWGDYRADLRAGIIASTVHNMLRAPDSKALGPDDFVPRFEAPEPVEEDVIKAKATMLAQIFGGEIKPPTT